MVSYLPRYETSNPNTTLSQAVSLANLRDLADAIDPYGTQPRCAEYYPLRG